MALEPLANRFQWVLMSFGKLLYCLCTTCEICRACGSRRDSRDSTHAVHRRQCFCSSCSLGASTEQLELATLADSTSIDEECNGTGDIWRASADHGNTSNSFCLDCCTGVSRLVSVACAVAVVVGVLLGMAMFILNGAIRVQEDFEIYEQGARNVVEWGKKISAHILHDLPDKVVIQISENALNYVKHIASEIIAFLLEYAGDLMFFCLMLGLYVMFWLCAPMPLNPKTESIFRRYFFLKGTACTGYGVSVGLLLYWLGVQLPVVFGLISFCFSFIPEVGAFLSMVMPVPVILFDSRLEAPAITLATALIGQFGLKFIFANIIEVKLIENDKTMKMHPVITLLAVTFFGFIWGPTGMLLSVPVMAYLKVVILSDSVPPMYRDPLLILIEGDRRAPERYTKESLERASKRSPKSSTGPLPGVPLRGRGAAAGEGSEEEGPAGELCWRKRHPADGPDAS
ncbi:unnamed protein product [Polarella glacialis]|uniref:Uncharacterized protein n=1 Tax=Polarella glacialis TaxID=89957 RepID=A0A813FUP8_POLGL|nr:unnamed protein product [Polarella glacialis]